MLSYQWVDLIKADQIKSFLISLSLIFLVSSAVFRSFKKGAVVTSPIVLAIGIDYAIYFQNKFDLLATTMDEEKAMLGVFTAAGKAIFWNVLMVVAGFLTFLFSQMPPNQKLGLICALDVTTSFISSIILLPVFLISKKTYNSKEVEKELL